MDTEKKEKSKVPFYKKWWFWAIIGLVVLGVIGTIVGNNSAENEEQIEQLPPETYYIGESVTIGSSSFTVVSVNDKTSLSYAEYSTNWERYPTGISYFDTVSTENNYIVVELRISNNDSKRQTYEAKDFLLYKGKTSYACTDKASAFANDNKYHASKSADPTLSTTLYVAFEVPSTHEQDIYVLKEKDHSHISILLGENPAEATED